MSSSSDGRNLASGDPDNPKHVENALPSAAVSKIKWSCKHCPFEIPAMLAIFDLPNCPVCGREQQEREAFLVDRIVTECSPNLLIRETSDARSAPLPSQASRDPSSLVPTPPKCEHSPSDVPAATVPPSSTPPSSDALNVPQAGQKKVSNNHKTSSRVEKNSGIQTEPSSECLTDLNVLVPVQESLDAQHQQSKGQPVSNSRTVSSDVKPLLLSDSLSLGKELDSCEGNHRSEGNHRGADQIHSDSSSRSQQQVLNASQGSPAQNPQAMKEKKVFGDGGDSRRGSHGKELDSHEGNHRGVDQIHSDSTSRSQQQVPNASQDSPAQNPQAMKEKKVFGDSRRGENVLHGADQIHSDSSSRSQQQLPNGSQGSPAQNPPAMKEKKVFGDGEDSRRGSHGKELDSHEGNHRGVDQIHSDSTSRSQQQVPNASQDSPAQNPQAMKEKKVFGDGGDSRRGGEEYHKSDLTVQQPNQNSKTKEAKPYQNTRSKMKKLSMLTGIHDSVKDSVAITFKVIVPLDLWHFDKDASRVCLQFGDDKLGNWEFDIGHFSILRETDDGCLLMQCQLYIDASLLQNRKPIPYKYLVYSSLSQTEGNSPYEVLHGVPKREKITNRCLLIPTCDSKKKGSYTQNDGIVLPERPPPSIKKRIINWIGFGSEEKEFLKHNSLQEKSFRIFLEEHKKNMINIKLTSTSKLNFTRCVEDIYRIYIQLRCRNICNGSHSSYQFAANLAKVFISWLLDIKSHLKSIDTTSLHESGARMCSVLVLLKLLLRVIFNLEELLPEDLCSLFGMLCLAPHQLGTQQWKSEDLDVLLNFIPEAAYGEMATCLEVFTNFVIEKRQLRATQWLYVLPLIHIFQKKITPFGKPAMTDIQWIDDQVRLNLVKHTSSLSDDTSSILGMWDDLMPLANLDPLFLPQLIYLCPNHELQELFLLVPTYLSTAFLNKIFSDVSGINARAAFKKLIQVVKSRVQNISYQERHDELNSTLTGALNLSKAILKSDHHEVYREIFHFSLSLILYIAVKYKICQQEESRKTHSVFHEVYKLLSFWMERKYSPVFGLPNRSKTCFECGMGEIKDFEILAGIDCPTEFQSEWYTQVLQTILRERVLRIKASDLIMNLLVLLESLDDPHFIITDVSDAVINQGFDTMGPQDGIKLESLYRKIKKHSSILGKILDKMLVKQYPRSTESLSMESILSWDHWPVFITLHKNGQMVERDRSGNQSQSSLPEHSDIMCTLAESTLEGFFSKCSLKLSIDEVEMIQKRESQVIKLHNATLTGSPEAKRKEAEEFSCLIQQKIQQVNMFISTRKNLVSLCQKLSTKQSPFINGLPALLDELQKDYSRMPMNALFNFEANFELICFKTANSLLSILIQFDILFKQKPSDFFESVWATKLKELVKSKTTLSIQEVVSVIWKPVVSQCCEILESIKSRSIKLREVNSIITCIGREHNICQQLHQLHSALELCSDRLPSSSIPPWINDSVAQMNQYLSLRLQADSAKTVLCLREKLQLSGNFDIIETVANKVDTSMQEQPLSSIDSGIITAELFLGKLTSKKQMLDSLQTFCDCLDVVEWIRKETKEISDLHTFVSVALHTSAGEGDLSSDKLSNLKTVGSGYGPLIYELHQGSSFSTFQSKCEAVWKAVEQTPKLPSLLVACNEELEWFKSVKETQASVEITSIGQMNNILQYGCYIIGSPIPRIYQSPHEVIQLALQEKEHRLVKKRYNLEELRDLESKLVLITGSKDERRFLVDLFLDTLHSVCHIAEVLLHLQQVGNVQYTGWMLQVPCSVNKDIIDHLQKLAKTMEEELGNWEKCVKETRGKYYEINYYTTLQLLTLRERLGIFKKSSKGGVVAPDVLALLQSISSLVDPDVVAEAVYKAVSNIPEIGIAEEQSLACSEMSETFKESTLADTVLSSATIQASATSLGNPQISLKPNLAEEDLSDDQQALMVHIVSRLNCSKLLVLKAFEHFLQKEMEVNDKFDYYRWCSENSDLDNFDDGIDSDGDESCVSEVDLHSNEESFVYPSDIASIKPLQTSIQGGGVSTIIKRNICIPEAIDENHWLVRELMLAGYSVEESIDAVEKTGALDASTALDYLQNQDENEDNPLLSTIQTQFNNQDSSYFDDVTMDWENCSAPIIHSDPNAEQKYLSLEQLGNVLKFLNFSLSEENTDKRPFSIQCLKEGYPNLLVLQPDLILKSVLHLYMEDSLLPLPSPEEVLLCKSSTTAEEVELFWMRAIHDPEHRRIFCLVHAEKLTNLVCDKALHSLSEHSQGQQGYRLVILYSNEEETKSHFISKLQLYQRPFIPQADVDIYRKYLKDHFSHKKGGSLSGQLTVASMVDYESSCVRIVTSQRSAMGKSLYIDRLAEDLKIRLRNPSGPVHVTIPLHGPKVTLDTLLEFFKDQMNNPSCYIYHIDIASLALSEVDTILFSLLILRGVCDSQGRVWRCHPDQLYVVEATIPNRAANTQEVFPEHLTISLLDMMPTVSCLSPCGALETMKSAHTEPSLIVMDDGIFKSDPYQRVFQYLKCYTRGVNLDSFFFQRCQIEGPAEDCLQTILHYCGVKDPSWSEICHFVTFLDLQLQSCEESVFTDSSLVGDVMAGLKGFVVKFMIRMSRDFSTSSLQGEVAIENAEDAVVEDGLSIYQISERKRWEQSPHPYIFFNQDKTSITFVGFMVQVRGQRGDLINPIDRQTLEQGIITKQLYDGLKLNRVDFQDDCRKWTKAAMIEKLSTVIGVEFPHDPDESYVLTVDNLIKIFAIQMRFRCDIPVVIMGETGCGKTRLIRYMCDLARQGMDTNNMLIMKVHGGTTEESIVKFIEVAKKVAEENKKHRLDTIVFFDEANTTESLGLIKEIMCDRRMKGKPITCDIKFIAACNPYRKHNDKMIERLESAGLGFFVRATETQQKLGKIPLRQLVYRVLDLPPSMRPLVYDFGQLNKDTERDYIGQIVKDHLTRHSTLSKYLHFIEPIVTTLRTSQAYMRRKDNECSFVSLRDVERAMIVFEYFYDMMDIFGPHMDEWACGKHRHIDNEDDKMEDDYKQPLPVTRALVLSLSVCYHARLQEREEFENEVIRCFTDPICLPGGVQQFRDEIRWCQEVLLDSMTLGNNIAKNAALRENVFMMAICVELRIPLFLVGKPGSSKSLAKAIISDSMRGKDSKKNLLKHFKEVGIFTYQCSQLSTSESVIEVFKNAERFQAKQDKSSYVAVVVLDEVGLAEDSPNLPLKALHPLLEDGTDGTSVNKGDFTDKIIDRKERVAFIGISNWALDPAKMNRGVMVTRADPDANELVFSARGICSNAKDDQIRSKLEEFFKPFATAYLSICKQQKREFFGLRDFYSLIKLLYYMCEKSGIRPTWQQLEHAIKRNFGGLESDDLDPFKEFEKCIFMDHELPDLTTFPEQIHSVINPDCSRLGLIRTSLSSREKTWHGENRYVLFLTENYAALDILKNPRNYLTSSSVLGQNTNDDPFILFGSSFPKDKEYTQVCRNINQVKICMETGRTVILLNLDNLYESLYDVLNQYYIYHADSRYVDLGLQTHRVRCRVADNFKLILIAEKNTVYLKFPTPLINRLEKHFVLTSSILEDWQEKVLHSFQEWISKFTSTRKSTFKTSDGFIGFQKDTPASVIFQATNQLRAACCGVKDSTLHSESVQQRWLTILDHGHLDQHQYDVECTNQALWEYAVLQLSQFLLLQTASPDAIIRLNNTSLSVNEGAVISNIYFHLQHHTSVEDFLVYHLQETDYNTGLLMQVTTHSHLLSSSDLDEISRTIDIEESHFSLHEFDTELDFSNKIGPTFKKNTGEVSPHRLVVIQCGSGHLNGDLIACARYRIYDLKAKADDGQITHVLCIIHLPRQLSSSLVSFQGDPWISAHIDDLKPSINDVIAPHEAIGVPISQLFIGGATAPPFDETFVSTRDSSVLLVKDDEMKGSNALDQMELANYSNDESLSEQEKRNLVGSFEHWEKGIESEEVKKHEADGGVVELSVEELDEYDENSNTGPEQSIPLPTVKDEKLQIDTEGSNSSPEEHPHIAPFMDETNQFSNAVPVMLSSLNRQLHTRRPLFRRLYSCIQPAASKLKDLTMKRCTRRVELLVHLIPKDASDDLDEAQFHGILIKHIHNLLEEREETYENEKNWVIEESMNNRNLLHGGTLCKALSRRVDKVVVHIFAEILTIIDQNLNLNLIDSSNRNATLSQFWLSMFSNSRIMQFKFTDFVSGRDHFPGAGARKAVSDFMCKLPFSWLIYEAVHALWDKVNTCAGSNNIELCNQLCEAVKQTDLGDILLRVDQHSIEDFYTRYLHDFVRIVHMCTQIDSDCESREYELIAEALDALLHGDDFCSIDGNVTLIGRIASIHMVYQLNKAQLLWFGQLVKLNPDAMVNLRNVEIRDKSELILHLCAVDKALDGLRLQLERNDETVNHIPWMRTLHASQNIIKSIINIPSQSSLRNKSRVKWNNCRALQLFIEHVILNHPKVPIAYLRRLQLYFMSETDFLTVDTLGKVQRHLNTTVKEAKKKKFIDKADMKNFEQNCCSYFMEVVSSLCFGQDSAPKPELVKMLMAIIFTRDRTRNLTPFTDGRIDKSPTIRSPLLQLLLVYNCEDVKVYLEEYFKNSQKALSGDIDKNLCLLCIQCFEDAMHKGSSKKLLEDRVQVISKTLEDAHLILCNYECNPVVNIAYLEAVAGVRFCLQEVAEILNLLYCGSQTSRPMSDSMIGLLTCARDICTDPTINTIDFNSSADVVGPGIYLVKLLVRRFGQSCLKRITEIHNWIIPERLKTSDQEKVLDPFVIYNENLGYARVRAAVIETLHRKQIDQLDESTKDLNMTEATIVLLAIYQNITMDYSNPARPTMDDDLREEFDAYLLKMKSFSPLMLQAARRYLTNQQGGPLAQMRISPDLTSECKILSAIVVHTISVISCNSRRAVLLPFVNMTTNPVDLAGAYLPTMLEDILQEVRKAGGNFFSCPNGHTYYVGECGRPVEVRTCNICGSSIGGTNHALRTDNTSARIHDTTQTGHDLGDAELRTSVPAPERTLSPSAICIMRAIMHSALIWCTCHHTDSIGDLSRIVKPFVPPDHLPEFFWRHLQRDIQQLAVTTGKNVDEAAVIVHLVLKKILISEPPKAGTISSVNTLMGKDARHEWERVFSTHYIQPVLDNLNTFNDVMELIVDNDQQELDQLFFLVYERVKVNSDSMGPHLWTYRQRVSLEHLGLTLQENKLKDKCPILHEFLHMEPKLRATQYLPHIVKLQQSLYDRFNYRLDRKDALGMTIGQFIQQLSENSRNEYRQWIESLQEAWALVGQDLKRHGRMPVEERLYVPAITMDTPLEYLIPTTSGAGVCTTSLVDYLILTHNDFIEKCRNIVTGYDESQLLWLRNDVPITHLHPCHLLDYQDQIVSVVLSHCHYSLSVGKAHSVEYNYQTLQKHILDKFIHGKPMILSDIPQVVYRTDIHSTATFAAVRNKVKGQVRLDCRVRKEILADLQTPDALRANLDVIDTVIGFLCSGGGKPNKLLGDYIGKVLKMQKRKFNQKAQVYCQLKHILSLWETLSVELSRLTWLRKQEPFDILLHENYLKELSVAEKSTLNRSLRIFDLNRLLGALYEFIETSMRYLPDHYTLSDVLVQDNYNNLDLPAEFEEEFPGDITIAQTVAVWKHIVDYQEELEHQ